MTEKSSQTFMFQLMLAFGAVYLIWGTSYLAMKVAVGTIPPFTVAAARFLIAGTVAFLFLRLRGIPNPCWLHWRSAALIGCLLMVGGNGLVMWAMPNVPSGVAALVVATIPLWMTLFDWLFYGGPRPTARVAIGLVMGLIGIVFLLEPKNLLAGIQGVHWPSMVALSLAPIFWAIGSLQSRHVDLPKNIFMTTALEAICGGFALLLLSIGMGETWQLDASLISTRSVVATLYLAIFGSLFTLTAYSWLLKNVSVARVSTYTFVNPVIAVFLGWLVLGEAIPWETIVAVILIVSAVVLIVMRKSAGQPASRIQVPTANPASHSRPHDATPAPIE